MSQDQRGFTVATISADEMTELTETRCWLEEVALRRSMASPTPEWEERLLILCHRLLRTPRSAREGGYAENASWERIHRAFHRALLERCGSRPLQGFCNQVADRLYRYRQLSVRKMYPHRDIGAEHRDILDAVLAGRADDAVAALQDHYRTTARNILADLF